MNINDLFKGLLVIFIILLVTFWMIPESKADIPLQDMGNPWLQVVIENNPVRIQKRPMIWNITVDEVVSESTTVDPNRYHNKKYWDTDEILVENSFFY